MTKPQKIEGGKVNVLRELWWTVKTKGFAPSMTYLEYFCWRILRQYGYKHFTKN